MATTTRPKPVEVSLLPCTVVRFFFSLGKSLVPSCVTDFSLAASHSLCIYMMRQGESRGQAAPSEPHFLERSKQTEPTAASFHQGMPTPAYARAASGKKQQQGLFSRRRKIIKTSPG